MLKSFIHAIVQKAIIIQIAQLQIVVIRENIAEFVKQLITRESHMAIKNTRFINQICTYQRTNFFSSSEYLSSCNMLCFTNGAKNIIHANAESLV